MADDTYRAMTIAAEGRRRYGRCPVCGAEPGAACSYVTSHDGHRRGDIRSEPHFYRTSGTPEKPKHKSQDVQARRRQAELDKHEAEQDRIMADAIRRHDLLFGRAHCDRKYILSCSELPSLILLTDASGTPEATKWPRAAGPGPIPECMGCDQKVDVAGTWCAECEAADD